jgi:hypothetical protein
MATPRWSAEIFRQASSAVRRRDDCLPHGVVLCRCRVDGSRSTTVTIDFTFTAPDYRT